MVIVVRNLVSFQTQFELTNESGQDGAQLQVRKL